MSELSRLAIRRLIDRREHHEQPTRRWRTRHRAGQLHLERHDLGRLSGHGWRGRRDPGQADQCQRDRDRVPGKQIWVSHDPVLRPGGGAAAETEKVGEWV